MTALTLADVKRQRWRIYWLGTISCISDALISAALDVLAVQWLMPHAAQILGMVTSVVLDPWKVLIQVLVLLWQGRNRAGAISRSAICGHFQDQAVSRVSRAHANALVKANETMRQARRPIAKAESERLKRAVLTSRPSLASVRLNTVK
jgi:hypothetical protein